MDFIFWHRWWYTAKWSWMLNFNLGSKGAEQSTFVNPDKEQETSAGQALFYVCRFVWALWFEDWCYMQEFASWKSITHFTHTKSIYCFLLCFFFWPTKILQKTDHDTCSWWLCSWGNSVKITDTCWGVLITKPFVFVWIALMYKLVPFCFYT